MTIPETRTGALRVDVVRQKRSGRLARDFRSAAFARDQRVGQRRCVEPLSVIARVTNAQIVGERRGQVAGQTGDEVTRLLRTGSRGHGLAQRIARQTAADVVLVAGQILELIVAIADEETVLVAEI